MKTILAAAFRLIICGMETIAFSVSLSMLSINSVFLSRSVQTPDCVADLTIQVNSNPSTIFYGQSSTVSWLVDLPPGCEYTSVQLNGNLVAPSGSQIVTPAQSTTYSITMFLIVNGTLNERTSSTRVTVEDSAIYFWCPYLLPAEKVDIGQVDRLNERHEEDSNVPWLDEVLNIPTTPLFLGPGTLVDYNAVNDKDLFPTVGPEAPLVNACAFVPMPPDLDPLLPERNTPAASPHAA